jgi:hypothetical protein
VSGGGSVAVSGLQLRLQQWRGLRKQGSTDGAHFGTREAEQQQQEQEQQEQEEQEQEEQEEEQEQEEEEQEEEEQEEQQEEEEEGSEGTEAESEHAYGDQSGGDGRASNALEAALPIDEEARGPALPIGRVRALGDYEATDDSELSFAEGSVISVLEKDASGWWWGRLDGSGDGHVMGGGEEGRRDGSGDGHVGMFPCTYVEWCLEGSS